MCIINNHSFVLANKNKHELVTFLTAAHICGWSCVLWLYKYFHLLALLGDMSTFILWEALFCFKFELRRVQPCWFALYERRADKSKIRKGSSWNLCRPWSHHRHGHNSSMFLQLCNRSNFHRLENKINWKSAVRLHLLHSCGKGQPCFFALGFPLRQPDLHKTLCGLI